MARRNRNKRPESVSGGYSAIPWCVIDSNSFRGASDKAQSLLFALMRQHNGSNNGHLHLANSWLSKQGWRSKSSNSAARIELIERGLIIQTKVGGLNIGASLFALTWLKISNYVGLDIDARSYRQGAYALCDLEPTRRRNPPDKKSNCPDHRDSTDPTIGTVSNITDPTTGSKKNIIYKPADPTTGHYVFTPLPVRNSIKQIANSSA